jgi:hypothetical protein
MILLVQSTVQKFFENPAISRHVLIGSQLAGNLKSTSGETTIRIMIFDSRFVAAGAISNREIEIVF